MRVTIVHILRRIYLWEIVKGLLLTLRHLVTNLLDRRRMPVIDYPEQTRPIPVRFRGQHRLLLRDDGRPRCVACFLCATVCPAECIHIEAEESDKPSIEKVPRRFDIDLLRCVFCGLCVEACPCDAIRMDTGEYHFAAYSRKDTIVTLQQLLGTRPMPGASPAPPPSTLPGHNPPAGGRH